MTSSTSATLGVITREHDAQHQCHADEGKEAEGDNGVGEARAGGRDGGGDVDGDHDEEEDRRHDLGRGENLPLLG